MTTVMPEWRLKSGEIVRSNQVPKKYWELTKAALAEEDGAGCQVVTVDIQLPEKALSWVVPTTPDDRIFFAAVHNRPTQLSRFTEGREPCLVQANLMLILKWRKHSGGLFLVKTAAKHGYIPPEPWEQGCQREDREWWSRHAYIYDQRNVELEKVYAWRHRFIHCFICGGRRDCKNAAVLGQLLICKNCHADCMERGYTELRKMHGWGELIIPVLR